MDLIRQSSPNHDERDHRVDTIILHYTGMQTAAEALERLVDPQAKVSAHYLVEEDGTIFQLVDEAQRAWHAGVASWRGATNINARSIGIEIASPGHEWGYRAFPETQIEAVFALVKDVSQRFGIDPRRVLGHADVAPQRKDDPGELFPWARLAADGLAVGPYTGQPDPSVDYADALEAIESVGYEMPETGPAATILAFQRRFCPAALGQGMSPLTKAAAIWAAKAFAAKGKA